MFRAGNGNGFYSYTSTDYDESHLYDDINDDDINADDINADDINADDINADDINADFTLSANINCSNDFMHVSEKCDFIDTVKTWLNSNSGKTVWDFVGDPNN